MGKGLTVGAVSQGIYVHCNHGALLLLYVQELDQARVYQVLEAQLTLLDLLNMRLIDYQLVIGHLKKRPCYSSLIC